MLKTLFRKEGLIYPEGRNVVRFFVDDSAVAHVRIMRGGRYRLCGCFVCPACRHRGIGTFLVLWRIAWCRSKDALTIDTFSYRPRLFYELGFAEKRRTSVATVMELTCSFTRTGTPKRT